MTDTPQTPKPRTPRWIKIALGLSLALNLAIVGLVAGSAYRFHSGGKAGPAARGGFILLSAMEREDRKAILSELRREDRSARQTGRANTAELLDVLRAGEFDRERAEALVLATRNATESMQERMQARWLEQVTSMSPEQRAAYADRLEEKMNRRGPKKAKKGN